MVMEELDKVSKQFHSPMIRFATIVHNLYDVLQEARMPLNAHFEWLTTQVIPINTKTSEEAYRLLENLLQGRGVKPSLSFRSQEGFEPIPVDDWYSNTESVELFYDRALTMMQAYCEKNPLDPEWDEVNKPTVNWNPAVMAFIGSMEFKLMIHDIIAVTRLILQSQKW